MLLQLFTARRMMQFIGFFLFAYTCLRAIVISITYDEAYTFLEFVLKPNWISPPANYMGANNHLLNTWLMKICYNTFGMSEFSLRFPNVLAHILYLYCSWKICNALFKSKPALFAFIIINTNPFLLDFFSLARGYGISIGLMMLSLYFLLKYISGNKIFYSLCSLIVLSFSVLANLSFIYFYFLLLFLLLLIPFYKKAVSWEIILTVLTGGTFLYFILPYIFTLDKAGAFFYGGNRDIFSETLTSLANASFYFDGDFYPQLSNVFVTIIVLILFVSIFIALKYLINKNKSDSTLFFQSICFIIIGILAGCTLQHIMLNTKLPYDRTSLYLIPLICLIVTFVLNHFQNEKIKQWLFVSASFLSALLFFHALNFSHVIAWKTNGITKTIFNKLKNEQSVYPLSIGIDFMFEPCFAYYKMLYNCHNVNYTFCINLNKTNKYFVITSLSKQNRYLNNFKTSVLINFEDHGVILYKNESYNSSPVETVPFKEDFENYKKETARNISDLKFISGKQSTICDSLDNYSRGIEIIINDTLINSNAFYFSSYFSSQNFKNNYCALVFSLENKTDGVYYWFPINVHVFGTTANWNKADYLMHLPDNVKKGDVLKIYFWNNYPEKIYVDDMSLRFLKY
jgi:hypothetical protein